MPHKVKPTLATRYTEDTIIEVGIDEAGRGCFWGPIVAGAVIWPAEADWTEEHKGIAPQIQDSKTISKKRRGVIAAAIKRLAVATGVGFVSAAEIDAYGINWANQEAFIRALSMIEYMGGGKDVWFGRILIDGVLGLPGSRSILKGSKQEEVRAIIDGDAKYLNIAAASIIAKVAHDEYVSAWCAKEEELGNRYDLMSSMGYGTARHRAAIKEHGLLVDHRRSFTKKTLGMSSCLVQEEA